MFKHSKLDKKVLSTKKPPSHEPKWAQLSPKERAWYRFTSSKVGAAYSYPNNLPTRDVNSLRELNRYKQLLNHWDSLKD